VSNQCDWGSFDVSLPRHGVSRYRLVVLPPGISAQQRRALRLWRNWPLWGAGIWLCAQMFGMFTDTGWAAFIGGVLLFMAVGALAFAATGDIPWQVRTISATSYTGYSHHELTRRHRMVLSLAGRMMRAERLRKQGRITGAEYEARWWQVYDEMTEMESNSTRSVRSAHVAG
jgi:hypothetical protein